LEFILLECACNLVLTTENIGARKKHAGNINYGILEKL